MGSLRSEIQNEVSQAWVDDIQDIALACFYTSFLGVSPVFDPDTNTITPAPSTVHPLNIVIDDNADLSTSDETYRLRDAMAIFPSIDLPVLPNVDDVVVTPDGIEWHVKAKLGDPAGAHYELHIRPQLDV